MDSSRGITARSTIQVIGAQRTQTHRGSYDRKGLPNVWQRPSVPDELIETASVALYDVAPEEFTAFALKGDGLASAAPDKSSAYNAAGAALFMATPDEFLTYNTAWKVLHDAAPDEFSALADGQKALYAAAPLQLTELDAAGLALYTAAPVEFTVFEYTVIHSGTIEALRNAAPREFAAYMAALEGSEAEVEALNALAAAAPDELAAASAIASALESSK